MRKKKAVQDKEQTKMVLIQIRIPELTEDGFHPKTSPFSTRQLI